MRPTWAEISLDSLKHNFIQVKKLVGENVSILSVVKANAYGHGALEASKAFIESGTDMLGVATLEEALELRDGGLGAPIAVMGGIRAHEAKLIVEQGLTPFLFSIDAARSLNDASKKAQKKTGYHLKFDTGMTRLGIQSDEAHRFLAELRTLNNIKMDGTLTHLGYAFTEFEERTQTQVDTFLKLVHLLRKSGFSPSYVHSANSASLQKYPYTHMDIVRPGIMLYGYGNHTGVDLKFAMKLKSKIIQLNRVPTETPVSYGGGFVTKRSSLIATIPIGYADGYMRSLSNRASVSIRGSLAPVVGQICMDYIMIDVTDVPEVRVDDEAILFGDEFLSANELAKWADTISYEVLSTVGKRVPRIYI